MEDYGGEFEVFLDIWEGRNLVGHCETEPKDEQGISSYSVQTCSSKYSLNFTYLILKSKIN